MVGGLAGKAPRSLDRSRRRALTPGYLRADHKVIRTCEFLKVVKSLHNSRRPLTEKQSQPPSLKIPPNNVLNLPTLPGISKFLFSCANAGSDRYNSLLTICKVHVHNLWNIVERISDNLVLVEPLLHICNLWWRPDDNAPAPKFKSCSAGVTIICLKFLKMGRLLKSPSWPKPVLFSPGYQPAKL